MRIFPTLIISLMHLFPIAGHVMAATHVQPSVISLEYDNAKLKAAGVLPYAMGEDGKVYVLLGRQIINTIPSSGMWKGFGGKRDPGETLVYTALREAKEESRAVLGEQSVIYQPTQFPFDQVIVTEHYNFKYLQLMAPIDWDPMAPTRFQRIFSEDPHVMEKLEVRWVAFEDLYQSISEAHQASIDQKCAPNQINRIIHVKSGSDFLPLARDFVETLATNFRNSKDSIHLLALNIMPIPASLSNDLDIVNK